MHPSPCSDPQYDDPFSDDAGPAERPHSAENFLEPHMIPPPNAASGQAPPLRSMSFHGQHPMNRTSSMGTKGVYSTMDPSRPTLRGRARQLSLQIPNGAPLLCYQHSNMQLPTPPVSGSPKHFAWVKQGQGEQNPTPGKIADPGRMTDFTHSLDRRRKLNGLNYNIPFSESFDEHRNPMREYLVLILSCCCCCLPDLFRGMGAWRKTMEPQKPGNSPGSGPEVVKRQRVAKE